MSSNRSSQEAAPDTDATGEIQAADKSSKAPETETLPLAQGYEYVTADSGSQSTVLDADDDSLTFGIMRNAEVVEKPTRETRKANRAQAKARVAATKITEDEHEARMRAAAAAAAISAAAERDRLAPALTTASASSEPEKNRAGSKVLFFGSAALTAGAIAAAAFLFLPGLNSSAEEIPVSSSELPTATATTAEPVEETVAPEPSFNTHVPTVTEQEAAVEEPVVPGTVQYAPVEAPAEPLPTEAPAEEVEPAPETTEAEPTEEATEEAAEDPTVDPTAEATPTAPAVEEPPAETSAPATPPVESSAPTATAPAESDGATETATGAESAPAE